ncbi:MAG: prepilin-type N-terminal cleavage/methylation domain-containing protein [Bdellovibrionales bacterium]
MRRSQEGFSLIELMIVVALSTVSVMAALAAYEMMFKMNMKAQVLVSGRGDLNLILDTLTGEALNVGGGFVEAYMGVWVEDNCASRMDLPDCRGSDRLTLAWTRRPAAGPGIPPLLECRVTSELSSTTFQMSIVPNCCVDNGWVNRQVLLTNMGWARSLHISAVDAITCQVTTREGLINQMNLQAGATWAGGYMTQVEVRTYFVNKTTSGSGPLNQLIVAEDLNRDPTLSADEFAIVASGIADFQIALGFDTDNDGYIRDLSGTANSTQDELLYSARAVGMERLGRGGLRNATSDLLYSVHLGVVVQGLGNLEDGTQRTWVLNGEPVTCNNCTLRSAVWSSVPRNRLSI